MRWVLSKYNSIPINTLSWKQAENYAKLLIYKYFASNSLFPRDLAVHVL